MKLPDTLRIMDANSIKMDSSLSFADTLGFRSGICCEFPLFDCLSKKTLSLHELPLTIMDATLASKYSNMREMEDIVKYYFNTAKRFFGDFVLLWHNSNFTGKYEKFSGLYQRILDIIANDK